MLNHKTVIKAMYLAVIGFSIGLLFFVVTCTIIGYDVKEQCKTSMLDYSGDCVESLISLLQDEGKPFRERNSAIWALGQLGDPRALPVLENYYTGEIPKRESLDADISQYELKKAIKLAAGGWNITAWAWRWDTIFSIR
jgi:hypothetical protein